MVTGGVVNPLLYKDRWLILRNKNLKRVLITQMAQRVFVFISALIMLVSIKRHVQLNLGIDNQSLYFQ